MSDVELRMTPVAPIDQRLTAALATLGLDASADTEQIMDASPLGRLQQQGLSADDQLKAIAQVLDIPFAESIAERPASAEFLKRIPIAFARQHCLLGLAADARAACGCTERRAKLAATRCDLSLLGPTGRSRLGIESADPCGHQRSISAADRTGTTSTGNARSPRGLVGNRKTRRPRRLVGRCRTGAGDQAGQPDPIRGREGPSVGHPHPAL